MKNYFLSSIFIFLFITSWSQEANIYWGKETEYERGAEYNLFGKLGGQIVGYKYKKGNYYIQRYNTSDLAPETEILVLGKGRSGENVIPRSFYFEKFMILDSKIFIFVSDYNRDTDEYSLFAQEVDPNSGLKGELVALEKIPAKRRSNSGSFEIYPSADSSDFLVVINPPYQKYAGEKFRFKTFSSSLKPIKEFEVSLPYRDKDFTTTDYIFADDKVYILAKIDIERGKTEKGEARYYYEILAVNSDGKGDVTEYEIQLPQKFISDISYTVDPEHGIICSGFYGDVKKGITKMDLKGLFYMRINPVSKKVEAHSTKQFEKDFIAELTSEKRANRGGGISRSFSMKYFVQKEDGGAVLISELAYTYTTRSTTTNSNGTTTTTTTHHYVNNNILAVNIGSDGNIKWIANIPKYQHTTNDLGISNSFLLGLKDDRMYFVFNDNPKNLLPDAEKIYPVNPRKSVAVLVELKENGKFTKKGLFSTKDSKMILWPSSFAEVGPSEYVVPAVKRGFSCIFPIVKAKKKMVRFEFK